MTTPTEHRGWTPGPWTPDPELTPSDPGAARLQCRFFYGPNGLAIFRMGLGYEDRATDEANAHLIAASPVLVEALEELLPLAEQAADAEMRLNARMTTFPDRTEAWDRWQRVKAALRLARGEK